MGNEGVSPETGIIVQAATEKGLRMGKGIKGKSPARRGAVLVLLLVGLGLTRLSQKFLDNNSVDTASGKGQWKGSSCSLRAHHVLSSAAEVAGPQAGQGLSRCGICDTGTILLGREWRGQASSTGRW